MGPGGAMADIVKYDGCLIIVHNGVTMDGKVLGSYEILAEARETVTAFAERSITRLSTIVETCDVVGDPRLPDREYLVEMAKCEIDFVLKLPIEERGRFLVIGKRCHGVRHPGSQCIRICRFHRWVLSIGIPEACAACSPPGYTAP